MQITYYLLRKNSWITDEKPYIIRDIVGRKTVKADRFNLLTKQWVPFHSHEEVIWYGCKGVDYNIIKFDKVVNIIKEQLPEYDTNRLYENLAQEIALDAHAGQVDKQGEPYYKHPFSVAALIKQSGINDINYIMTGYLHDVIEDSNLTAEDLLSFGIPQQTVTAVEFMTHEQNVSYEDYLINVCKNPIAQTVKIHDLMHNLDPSRRSVFNDRLRDKYKKAIKVLKSCGADTSQLDELALTLC